MVGILSNNDLGLFNSSIDLLGLSGGSPSFGQAKGNAYVNIATGNLSIQFLDESLSGTGADLFALRTYNSMGNFTDGDADGWRWNGERKIILLSGTAGATGSTIKRILNDGAEVIFTWDVTKNAYVSKSGATAHDVVSWNAGANEWVFREDGSNVEERYNGTTGWIKSLRDASGNGFDYSFSGDKLSQIVDLRSGQTIAFVYGNNGKLSTLSTRSTISGAFFSQVYYTYDASNRLATVKTDLTPSDNSIADNNTYTTTYTYDGTSTRIASITQGDGSSVSFFYDSLMRINKVIDHAGTTTFTYNAANTVVKNGVGNTWTYAYNSTTKQLLSVTSSQGKHSGYTYDADGNVKTVVNGTNNTITYTYDSNGNRIKEVDTLGNTVARTYGALNQLLTETRYTIASTTSPANPETTRYVYDSLNRLRFVISPEGKVSETRYNNLGLIGDNIQYTNGLYSSTGASEAELINWSSSLSDTQKSSLQLTSFEYDYRGNLSRKIAYASVSNTGSGIVDNSTDITKYTYSENGQLLQTIRVLNSSTPTEVLQSSVAFDGLGRQISLINQFGTTTTTYSGVATTVSNTSSGVTMISTTDSAGRLVSVNSSGSGTSRVTKYYYDNAGQLRMTEDPTGARTYLFYDVAGRINARVDAKGATSSYVYDKNNKILTETLYANLANTSTWFDNSKPEGSKVTISLLSIGSSGTHIVTDSANDRTTNYTYDSAGRLTSTLIDGLATKSNTYDGTSRLVQTQQGDRISRFFYDKDGRLIGQLNAERNLTETIYDSAGRVLKSIRYGGQVSVTNQLSNNFSILKAEVVNSEVLETYYFYDNEGRQTGIVNEQGFLTETVYDTANNQRRIAQYKTAVSVTMSDTLSSLKSRAGSANTTITQYDDYGRTSTITDTDGIKSRNIYDAAGRLIRHIEAEGTSDQRSIRHRYNEFGEIIGTISGTGEATLVNDATPIQIESAINNLGTRYDIDGAGRKIVEYRPSGQKILMYYNVAGQLEYTINTLGEVNQIAYNAFGQVTQLRAFTDRIDIAGLTGGLINPALLTKITALSSSVNSANDKVTSTTYNKLGLISSSSDADGFITNNAYSQYGQLGETTKALGQNNYTKTKMNYDLLGRAVDTYQDADGFNLRTSLVYDGFGRISKNIDSLGNIINTLYQDQGRSIIVVDALGKSSRIETDALGRTLKSYDAYNNLTSYSYDDATSKFTVTAPDGTQISTWKTKTGETLKIVDAKGAATEYTYTKDGQVNTIKNALGQIILDNNYDTNGRISESLDANGTVTKYTYDAANRIVEKVVDSNGLAIRTKYEFDGQGRQILITNAAETIEAQKTQYIYTRKGQIKQIIVSPDLLKLSTLFTYDALGNTLKIEKGTIANPSQYVTTYTFDKLGRKISETIDPNGVNITTIYKYDGNGNVSQVIDATNQSTWYIYNTLGQRTYQINALGGVTRFEYEKNGKLSHIYEFANAITTTSPDTLVSNFVPPDISVNDRHTYNIYDKNGRLAFNLQAANATEWIVSQTVYDANGNVIEVRAYDKSLSNTGLLNVTADASDQGTLITTTELSNLLTELGYTESNTGNARITKYEYDAANRQIKTILPGWYDLTDAKVYALKENQTDRFQRTIEVAYDNLGNAVSNKIRTGVADYVYQYKTYDAAGRIVDDIDALGYVSQRKYDALGNIVSITRTDVPLGTTPTRGYWKTTDIGPLTGRTISYNYDSAGRKISQTQSVTSNNYKTGEFYTAAASSTFEYDALGRLQKQSSSINNSGELASTFYYYDTAGRRIFEVDAAGFATRFEYNNLGNAIRITEYATAINSPSLASQPAVVNAASDRIVENEFDLLGRITNIKRRLGGEASLTIAQSNYFNIFGNTTETIDAANNSIKMEYNKLGTLVKTTDPQRTVASTFIDPFRNQVLASPTIEYLYNNFGENIKEIRSTTSGRGATLITERFYDFAGNQVQTKDENGNLSTNGFDISGKIIRQAQAISAVSYPSDMSYSHTIERRFEYDKTGRQIATLDIVGSKQSGQYNVYNGYGEVISEYKIWGSASSTSASLISTATQNALIATYTYDSNGKVATKRNTEGFTYYWYDLAGNVTRSEQRGSNNATYSAKVTEATYNKLNQVTLLQLPSYSTTTATNTTVTTSANPIVSQSYDRWGNTLTKTDSANQTTSYAYNQDNKVISEKGPNTTAINYHGTVFATSIEHQYIYDSAGNKTADILVARKDDSIIGAHTSYSMYNEVGQLVKSIDASGVAQQYVNDTNGNRVGTKDAAGFITVDEFNNTGSMTKHSLLRTSSGSSYTGSTSVTPVAVMLATYKYDQAGRKYGEADASYNYNYYKYDERNNLIREIDRQGNGKNYTYDELGNKTLENVEEVKTYSTFDGPYGSEVLHYTTTNIAINKWSFYLDDSNTDFKDYGTNQQRTRQVGTDASLIYDYSYNTFGQLAQESQRGTNKRVTYMYWENGLQKGIQESIVYTDSTAINTSTFYYDIRGNKTAEYDQSSIYYPPNIDGKTSDGKPIYTPEHTDITGESYVYYQYDALNRLSAVQSPAGNINIGGTSYATAVITSLNFDYDEWGNRRRIKSHYQLPGTSGDHKEEWFVYDEAGRALVEHGITNGATAIASNDGTKAKGVAYMYDAAGRRVSEEVWIATETTVTSYGTTVPWKDRYKQRLYTYNDLGLLAGVTQRENLKDYWSSTAPIEFGNLVDVETNKYDDRGFKYESTSFLSFRKFSYTYFANGRMKAQSANTLSGNRRDYFIDNYVYNAEGNLKSYQYLSYDTSTTANTLKFTNTYSYTYQNTYSGSQNTAITVTSTQGGTAKGTTSNYYDFRGRLVSASITEAHISDSSKTGQSYRYFAYNAQSQIIGKSQRRYGDSTKTQNYYYSSSGGELANYGSITGVDISPLSSIMRGSDTPGSYDVSSGDTLMSISQAMFGDSRFWYLIAEANGLSMGPNDQFATQDIGRNLRIPNSDKAVGNTNTNWKPYNSNHVIGDLTPNPKILPPPKQNGCGIFAIILIVVVAIVATIVTAGAAAIAMGAVAAGTGVFAAGTAALSGGLIAGGAFAAGAAATAGTVAGTIGVAAAGIAAATIGGFVGSVASQAAGMLMHVQDKFSWKSAFASGLAAGISAGAGAYLNGLNASTKIGGAFVKAGTNQGLTTLGQATKGAAGYLSSLGSKAIFGLEANFNWKDLALASLQSVVSSKIHFGKNGKAPTSTLKVTGNSLATNLTSTAINKSLNYLAGRAADETFAEMAADAFGNIVANSFIETMTHVLATRPTKGLPSTSQPKSAPTNDGLEQIDSPSGGTSAASLATETATEVPADQEIQTDTPQEPATYIVDKKAGSRGYWGVAKSLLGPNASNREILDYTQKLMSLNSKNILKVGDELLLPTEKTLVSDSAKQRYAMLNAKYQAQQAERQAAMARINELENKLEQFATLDLEVAQPALGGIRTEVGARELRVPGGLDLNRAYILDKGYRDVTTGRYTKNPFSQQSLRKSYHTTEIDGTTTKELANSFEVKYEFIKPTELYSQVGEWVNLSAYQDKNLFIGIRENIGASMEGAFAFSKKDGLNASFTLTGKATLEYVSGNYQGDLGIGNSNLGLGDYKLDFNVNTGAEVYVETVGKIKWGDGRLVADVAVNGGADVAALRGDMNAEVELELFGWKIVPSVHGEGHLLGAGISGTAGFKTYEGKPGGKLYFGAGLTALIGGKLKFGIAFEPSD